jgi:hypothetical protein
MATQEAVQLVTGAGAGQMVDRLSSSSSRQVASPVVSLD